MALQRHLPRSVRRLLVLLEFHPWMLALIVFLACATGVAIMEGLRDRPAVVAQANVQAPAQPGR
ncbi:MAG TPA: hypothetical protein VEB43_12120 [Anaeromyxobacter sp.]|nr:hypothetical protein [Anaeromyxobacter sp.]